MDFISAYCASFISELCAVFWLVAISTANTRQRFYTNVSASSPMPGTSTTGSTGSNSSTSNTQSSGNTSTTGTTPGGTSGGSTGGTTGGSSNTPSIATFAAGIDLGDTKTQVNGQASGLGQGCSIVADATATNLGKQEVCTYTQGDKIVTVTYLNDRVIGASKSGF